MYLDDLQSGQAVISFNADDLKVLASIMEAGLGELIGAEHSEKHARGEAMLCTFRAAAIAAQYQNERPGGDRGAGAQV